NLGRRIDGSEIRNRLRNTAVGNLEVLTLQPVHKIAFGIRDDHPDVYAIHFNANAGSRGSRVFLRSRGNAMQNQPKEGSCASAEHPPAACPANVSPATRQSALPWRPSKKPRSRCADAGEKRRG